MFLSQHLLECLPQFNYSEGEQCSPGGRNKVFKCLVGKRKHKYAVNFVLQFLHLASLDIKWTKRKPLHWWKGLWPCRLHCSVFPLVLLSRIVRAAKSRISSYKATVSHALSYDCSVYPFYAEAMQCWINKRYGLRMGSFSEAIKRSVLRRVKAVNVFKVTTLLNTKPKRIPSSPCWRCFNTVKTANGDILLKQFKDLCPHAVALKAFINMQRVRFSVWWLDDKFRSQTSSLSFICPPSCKDV